jgi:hypothetical protein
MKIKSKIKNISSGKILYKIASIFRCIDIGKDKVLNRFTQPLFFSITFSTWIKVYFPNIVLSQGLNFIVLTAAIFVLIYFISGFFWQKTKLLGEEYRFDGIRNPVLMEINNRLKKIEGKIAQE